MERAITFGIHLSNLNPIAKSNLGLSSLQRLVFSAAVPAPQEIDRSFFQFFMPHERQKRRVSHISAAAVPTSRAAWVKVSNGMQPSAVRMDALDHCTRQMDNARKLRDKVAEREQ